MKSERLTNNTALIGLALVCLTIGMIFWGAGRNCDASVVYPAGPDAGGGRQAVLEMIRQDKYLAATVFKGVNVDELTIGSPYRDYTIGINDVAAGRLLAAAKLGPDWLYPVMHGTALVAVAWVKEEAGKPPQNAGIEEYLSIERLDALRVAEQLPQVKDRDYEFRLLSVSSVFEVVWLHSESDDILIPLDGPLTACQPYSEDQIIEALKPEAESRVLGWVGGGCDQNPDSTAQTQPQISRIRVGESVAREKLVHKVDPVYPLEAEAAKVSGTVILNVIIDKYGDPQEITFVSGPEMLSEAAIEAVRQWRYKPTLLVGQPVEVDTTVSVVFSPGR